MLDLCDTSAGVEDTAAIAKLAQVTLQKRMRIKPDTVQISDPMNCLFPEEWTELVDCALVETLEFGEQRNLRIQRVQRLAFVFASMDQDRHSAAERHVAKLLGRFLEEGPAGTRQRPGPADPQAHNATWSRCGPKNGSRSALRLRGR